jgi:hypothetical protein
MYDWIGDGRDGNKRGERCSILYRKDKFDLVDSGTKWLSDTPDVSGSRLNGSEYIRIATYVILKDKVSGQEFMHINTHLDTSSSTIRAAQAKLAIELSPKRDDMPVFFTGDFNCSFESEGYNTITGTLGFVNSATKAVAGDKYTNQTSDYGAIDFIFIKNYNLETLDKDGKVNPITSLITTILLEVAQMERHTIIERMSSGRDQYIAKCRKDGIKMGRPASYRKSDDTMREQYKKEIALVKQGISLRNINAITNTSIATIRKLYKFAQ